MPSPGSTFGSPSGVLMSRSRAAGYSETYPGQRFCDPRRRLRPGGGSCHDCPCALSTRRRPARGIEIDQTYLAEIQRQLRVAGRPPSRLSRTSSDSGSFVAGFLRRHHRMAFCRRKRRDAVSRFTTGCRRALLTSRWRVFSLIRRNFGLPLHRCLTRLGGVVAFWGVGNHTQRE